MMFPDFIFGRMHVEWEVPRRPVFLDQGVSRVAGLKRYVQLFTIAT